MTTEELFALLAIVAVALALLVPGVGLVAVLVRGRRGDEAVFQEARAADKRLRTAYRYVCAEPGCPETTWGKTPPSAEHPPSGWWQEEPQVYFCPAHRWTAEYGEAQREGYWEAQRVEREAYWARAKEAYARCWSGEIAAYAAELGVGPNRVDGFGFVGEVGSPHYVIVEDDKVLTAAEVVERLSSTVTVTIGDGDA